jgi:pyridoxal phosphate enzyme (YggS family)
VTAENAEIEGLRVARARVLERIADACARVGRDPAGVTLVAVTKTVEVERVRAAVEAGLTILGENRVQEGAKKAPLVAGATWHLIGPLQSNKARSALESFDVIQTVDSTGLAARLGGLAAGGVAPTPYPVLVQVNVDADPAKSGLLPDELDRAVDEWDVGGLEVRGLMTVGRLVADAEAARPTFVALRALSERLRARWPALGPELSMGMTDDFEVAVEEGATIVRVGRALFGERPPAAA